MDKIISFGKGIRRQPSVGEDGELSELVNLIPKNGELVNVRPMKKAKDSPEIASTEKILAIHKVQRGINYITQDGGSLRYYYYDESELKWASKTIASVKEDGNSKVEVIGNTLVFLGIDCISYYLWKEGEYLSLGSKPPQLDISFGLQTEIVRSEVFSISPSNGFVMNVEEGEIKGKPWYNRDDKEYITQAVLGQVNKLIKEESIEKGRFMYPFFVRYAYRLYDDSLTMHSSPVLMVCSTKCAPKVDILKFYEVTNGLSIMSPKADFRVLAAVSKLDFLPSVDFGSLGKWKDIIKSVDVFVSKPIYTYDQEGEIGGINTRTEVDRDNIVIGKHINRYKDAVTGKEAYSDYSKKYQKSSLDALYAMTFSSNFSYNEWSIELPSKSEDEVKKEIKDCSLFYFLDSFSIDKLSEITSRTTIEIGDDVLGALTTREVMSDDYRTHDTAIASYATVYNSRLNLAGIKRCLFSGFKSDSVFAYTDGYILYNDSSPEKYTAQQDVKYYVYIKEGDKDIIVGGDVTSGKAGTLDEQCNPLLYFYYPNPNAYKLVVRTKDYIADDGSINYPLLEVSYEVPLEPHNLLQGSFYFRGWDDDIISYSNKKGYTKSSEPKLSEDATVVVQDKLWFSEVNNPFFFSARNRLNFGAGDILDISTAAKALSPSQFGQFPLYAFCKDGIWALEIADDGTYLPPKIVSNDICNNSDSITQIESSVVFTTDQGLKLIQGSEVMLLSATMDGHNVDESIYFPPYFFIDTSKNQEYEVFDRLVVNETRDFRTILSTCKIAYDYPNRLLRIFPKGGGKWYVYSLDTREFACEESLGTVNAVVAGYPTPLVQIGTTLYTFGNEVDSNILRNGLLLTRPIDMGEPFAMKKLQDIKLHYTKHNKEKGAFVKMVMYVSNDGEHWHVLPSLRKRSFKYYRIALITKMTDNDALSGMIMRYEVERTNKIR